MTDDTNREKLQKALHDVHVAKEEIDNYHAGMKLASAQNKIESVLTGGADD